MGALASVSVAAASSSASTLRQSRVPHTARPGRPTVGSSASTREVVPVTNRGLEAAWLRRAHGCGGWDIARTLCSITDRRS